jgi:hypothetical protein
MACAVGINENTGIDQVHLDKALGFIHTALMPGPTVIVFAKTFIVFGVMTQI